MNALPPFLPFGSCFATPSALVRATGRVPRRTLRSGLALLLPAAVAVGVLLSGVPLRAQFNRPALITQSVNETERTVLTGNVHPRATASADRGAVSESLPVDRLLLLLKRSPEQERSLRAAIESLHNPDSPEFHKWLTPEQFGSQWGATDSDIAAVTAWLQSHGFEVKGPTAGRTAIEFSGTAGQVRDAFHTEIHAYMVNGELHHANATDPEIPAALAPVVAGITSLNDFRPRSMMRKGPRGIYDETTHKAHPQYTTQLFGGSFLYVGPADAATIYDSPVAALNPSATGAKFDGTGSKIGIVGDSNISVPQTANYRKLFGLSSSTPKIILDGADPGVNGDAVEAYLDIEIANALAPGASVYFYLASDTDTAAGVDLAAQRAVNDNVVDVLNVSFGLCEGFLTTSGNQFYASLWEQAVAQGISVTVSSGDSGSAGCDPDMSPTLAYHGLQVNGVASTPDNIAVGGTDFAVLAGPDGSGADFLNYAGGTNSPGTLRSAFKYIPEVPWNDSSFMIPPGPIATTQQAPSYDDILEGGSGGKSNCSVGFADAGDNLHCTSGYAKPSWQAGKGVPADAARDLPDVSLFAANGLDYATWGVCTDQDTDANNNPITDCTSGSDGLPAGQFNLTGVGGTSASAPAFAGVLALVRQSTGERQGQAAYVLYNLARTVPKVFHDVVTGNNSVPCKQGTLNCIQNTKGSYYVSGYDAGSGYDLASGLGSVDISALIANWASAGMGTTTTRLTITPTSFQHGQRVVADATVTGVTGVATGSVTLTADENPPSLPASVTVGTYPLLADGSTGDFTLNSLPGGKYNVVATYAGAAKSQQSVSPPVALTVTAEPSVTDLTVVASNPHSGVEITGNIVPYGYPQSLTAFPYGIHSPVVDGVLQPDGKATGKVTFTAGATNLGTATIGPSGTAELTGSIIVPGTYSIAAAYGGDASFDPSTGTKTVRVTKAETDLKMTTSARVYVGQPIVFTVTLTTLSDGVAPTGTVLLMEGTKLLAQGTLVGTAREGAVLAGGTVSISTSSLPPGTLQTVAVYSGDANYEGSSSNTIPVRGKPSFSIASVRFSLYSEHTTGGAYVQTNSLGGYSGTIDYTCTLLNPTHSATPAECAVYPNVENLVSGGRVSPLLLIFGKGTKLPTGVIIGDNTPSGNLRWLGAGGTALACCLLLCIPARRRGWRSMLSLMLLLAAAGGFTACIATPKFITAGVYQFQVTGTDSKDSTNTASGIATVTVK